jgi:hypothetical protein
MNARTLPAVCITSVTLLAVLFLLPQPLFAQGGTVTASLSGRVVDDTGGVLPGTTVTVVNQATNQGRTVVADDEGFYVFSGLPPSRYSLSAELQGFSTMTLTDLVLNVGAAVDQQIVMRVATLAESITVTGEAPLIERRKTDLSTLITKEQIEALPANSRNYLDFALLTPAAVENFTTSSPQQGIGLNIGGARAKEGSLLVDGFWNTDESFGRARIKYSQDSIQEFQVVSLGGTAEYGRAIGGVVTAVTRSGGNVFNGSGYGYFRDKALNAQTPLEKQRGQPKSEFDRQLYGWSVGGPIVRDRTFFFNALEWTRQDTPADNNINPEHARTIGLPPQDVGTLPSTVRSTFAMGKVDHRLSENHSVSGAYIYSKFTALNTEFQSFTARSRTIGQHEDDWAVQFGWTGLARQGRWLHELKTAYFPRDYMRAAQNLGGPPLSPDGQLRALNAPQVNITNVANFGGAFINNNMKTRPTQALYASTISKNRHTIKFGGDAMFVDFDYWQYANSGTYNFRSLDHFLRGEYTTYTQTFGPPLVERYHSYVSAFVQDSWTASDRVTVNYGLRYDLELLSKYKGEHYGSDYGNVGPRFAMSYDLTGKGRTLVKVSTGLFYDHVFQNPITPAYFQNKNVGNQVSATWLFGQAGAPLYPNVFADLPATAPRGVINVWIVPDDYEVPMSTQFVTTLDHGFSDTLAASISFLYNRSWNKELRFDTNLRFDETTGRWTRPDSNFRAIEQYSYTGRAEYTGMIVEARQRLSRKLIFNGNVTLARAYDMGNNFNSTLNDQRFPDAEWGPSADTPTWRAVGSAVYSLTDFVQLSAIYRGRGGYAFDARTGNTFDLNADGNFNDRTPGFSRNSFRGPATHQLDARLSWNVRMWQKRLQLTAEGFNILNRENVRAISTTYGPDPDRPLPLFGTPLNYFPPREIQVGVRFTF